MSDSKTTYIVPDQNNNETLVCYNGWEWNNGGLG